MGERAKKVLEHIKTRTKEPVFRNQDGSQASPESLPLSKNNGLNDKNKDQKINNESFMSDKPMIQCPHCSMTINVEKLVSQRIYRNEFGIDVFECPDCSKNYKFEPTEYLKLKESIQQGNHIDTPIITASRVDELMSSEKIAIDYDRGSRAPWRGPVKAIAIIVLFIIIFRIID